MRYVNMLFAALMALFAFVQLNDPDGYVWFFIYLIPGIIAALAAFRLPVLATAKGLGAVVGLTVLSLVGVVAYWPTTPGFWHQEVWWETETAREGMGMMIVAIVMIAVLCTVWSARRHDSAADHA